MMVRETLKRAVERFPDKPALIFEEKTWTFKELEENSYRFGRSLLKKGLKKGDKCIVFLPNSPEYILSYLTLFILGVIVIPLDIFLKSEEIERILRHCEPQWLFTAPRLLEFLPLEGFKKENIVLLEEGEGFSSIPYLCPERKESSLSWPILAEDDLCAIFYTSGSTGLPKGIVWSFCHLDQAPKIMNYFLKVNERDISLCAMPLSHAGGLVYLENSLVLGATTILMERFKPLEFVKYIEQYKVTCFHIVPSMLQAILDLKSIDKFDFSSLRWVALFGAPSSSELLKDFKKRFPSIPLINGYGLMETSPPNTLSPLDKVRSESVGMPPPWLELKVMDERGLEVKRGEIGEVVMKGWPVARGYYNAPELTEEVFRNGYFYTGDLGRMDEDGYLYIEGRKKDLIISGGLNINPLEIEEVILSHKKVKEVAVIGASDRLRGEIVKALVVPKEGESLVEEELLSLCRQRLARVKIPKIIEFTSSLPKTGSGKIAKAKLKERREV